MWVEKVNDLASSKLLRRIEEPTIIEDPPILEDPSAQKSLEGVL